MRASWRWWCVLGLALPACAAARGPAQPEASAPTSDTQAEADFNAALAEVDRGLGNPPSADAFAAQKAAPGGGVAAGGDGVAAASPAPAPLPQAAPPVAPAEAPPARAGSTAPEAEESGRDEAQRTAADPCVEVCRALGSLARAAEAICRIAGEADERCTRARGIVTDRNAQASRCACQR